jgi:hypothetical protein
MAKTKTETAPPTDTADAPAPDAPETKTKKTLSSIVEAWAASTGIKAPVDTGSKRRASLTGALADCESLIATLDGLPESAKTPQVKALLASQLARGGSLRAAVAALPSVETAQVSTEHAYALTRMILAHAWAVHPSLISIGDAPSAQ